MNISDSFKEIIKYTHIWNWAPDWSIVEEIYLAFPDSYAILSPFAYSYLEEIIRSTTSEYGMVLLDENRQPKKRKVGYDLIKLAIKENKSNKPHYAKILDEIKNHYIQSQPTDEGENRHSVVHGYMHPRFWNKESFEKLIFDIARISKYAGF